MEEENKEEAKEETKEEIKEEIKEQEKINVFKKIWYSITKISKYEEMTQEGIKKAIKYFLFLTAILSVVLAVTNIIYIALFIDIAELTSSEVTELTPSICLYYGLIYFFSYLVILILIFFVYDFIITVCMFVLQNIFKVKESFGKTLSTTLYSSTLAMILYVLYMIISTFVGFTISYVDVVAILLIYIYIAIIFFKKRREIVNDVYRTDKK